MEQLWDVIQAQEAARLAVQMLAEAANRSKVNKHRCQEVAEVGERAINQLELAVHQRAPDQVTLMSIAAQLRSVANQSRARVEELGNPGAIGRFAVKFRRKQVEEVLAKERRSLQGLLDKLATAATSSTVPPLRGFTNLSYAPGSRPVTSHAQLAMFHPGNAVTRGRGGLTGLPTGNPNFWPSGLDPVLPELTTGNSVSQQAVAVSGGAHNSLRQVIGREGRLMSASCESVGLPTGDEAAGETRGGCILPIAQRTLRASDSNSVQHVSFMRGAASESAPLQLMVALPKQVEVYSFQLDAFRSDTPLTRPEQQVTATTLYEPTVDLIVGHNGGTVLVYGRVGQDTAQSTGNASTRGATSGIPLVFRVSRNAVTALHCVPAVELDVESNAAPAPAAGPRGSAGSSAAAPGPPEIAPASTADDTVAPGGVGSGTVHDVLLLAGDAIGRVIAIRYSRMQPEVQAGAVFVASKRSAGEAGGSQGKQGNLESSNLEITSMLYRSGILVVSTANCFIYVVRMVSTGNSGANGGNGEGAGGNCQSGTGPTRPQTATSGGGTASGNTNSTASAPNNTIPNALSSMQDGATLPVASSVNLLSPTTSAMPTAATNRAATTIDSGIRKSALPVSTVVLEAYYSGDLYGPCTALVALEWGTPGAGLPPRTFADSYSAVPSALRGARAMAARQGSWRMLSAHASGQLLMWDLFGGKLQLVCTIGEPGPFIISVCAFPNLGTMIEVLQSGHLRVGPLPASSLAPPANPLGGVPVWRLRQTLIRAHRGPITAAASLHHSIATGSKAGGVKVWDAAFMRSQAMQRGVPFLSLVPPPSVPFVNGSIGSALVGVNSVMTNGTTSPPLSTRNLNCYNGNGGGGPAGGGAGGPNGHGAANNSVNYTMTGTGPAPPAPYKLSHLDMNFNNSIQQQVCVRPGSPYQSPQYQGSHGSAPPLPHPQLQHPPMTPVPPMHADPYANAGNMPAMYPQLGGTLMRPSGPLSHMSRGALAAPLPDSGAPLPPAVGILQPALTSPTDSLKAPPKYLALHVHTANGAMSEEDGASASRRSSYGGGGHLAAKPRTPAPQQAQQSQTPNLERHTTNGTLDTSRQATQKANTYTTSAMEEAVKAAMEFAGGGCSGVCTASGAADDRREASNLPFVPPAGMSQEEVEANRNDKAPRTAPSSPRPVLTPLSPRVQQYSPNLFRVTSMGGSQTFTSPYPLLADGWAANLPGANHGLLNRSMAPASPLSTPMNTPFNNPGYMMSGMVPTSPHGMPPPHSFMSSGGASSHHMAYHALTNGGASSHHMAYNAVQNGGAGSQQMAYCPQFSRTSDLGAGPSNGYYGNEVPLQRVPGPPAPVQPLQRRLSTLSDYDGGYQERHQSGLTDPAMDPGEPYMPRPPVLPPPAPDPTAAPSRAPRNEVNPLLQNAFIRPDDLRLIDPIGQGAEGTVWRGRWHHIDVAVKEMHPACASFDRLASIARDLHSPDSAGNSEVVAGVVREVSALIDLGQHPNIIRFVGVCAAPPRIITEYYKKGSLFTMLKEARQGNIRTREQLSWYRRLVMLQDIAAGMSYLHSRNYIHGDLRSPNVFVTEDQHLKIGDFGFAKILSTAQNPDDGVPARFTNPRWQAPEVYSMDNPKATTTADVYSFGIIMYELLTFQQPYHDVADDTAVKCRHSLNPSWRPTMPLDHKLPVPKDVHLQAYKALMMDCWTEDPDERPTFHKVAERLMALIRWQRVLSVVRKSLWGARPLRRTPTPVPEAGPSTSATANGTNAAAAGRHPNGIPANAGLSTSNGRSAPAAPSPGAIVTRHSGDSTGSNPEAGQLSHLFLEIAHSLTGEPNLLLEIEREVVNKQNGVAQVTAAGPSGSTSRSAGPAVNGGNGANVPARRKIPSSTGDTALESAPTFANHSAFRARAATIGLSLLPIQTQQQGQGARSGNGTAAATQPAQGTGRDAFTMISPFNAMGTLSDDEDDVGAGPSAAAAGSGVGKPGLPVGAPTVLAPPPMKHGSKGGMRTVQVSVPSVVTPHTQPQGSKGGVPGAVIPQQPPGPRNVAAASAAAASTMLRTTSGSAAACAAKVAAPPETTPSSQGLRGSTAALEERPAISHPAPIASMTTSGRVQSADPFSMSSPFNGVGNVDSDEDSVPAQRPAAPAAMLRSNAATASRAGSAPPAARSPQMGPRTDDPFAMRTPFHPSFLPNLDEDD